MLRDQNREECGSGKFNVAWWWKHPPISGEFAGVSGSQHWVPEVKFEAK
jgi:hypothetical protein